MSRGLGQTELLDVAPSRRLIVPAGHTSHWGVDPSSVRVAIATVTADGARGVSLAPFSGADAGRLLSVFTETQLLARSLIDECGLAPGVIVCEQPSGKTPNPMLLYSTGATLAALASCVAPGVRIEMVASARWKAVACGKGNLYKPKGRARPEDYPVLVWARELGYVGSSWDAADAYGVAEYARRTFALEER